jgi:hypothetical protein
MTGSLVGLVLAGSLFAAPKVLLHHSFDGAVGKPDVAPASAKVIAGDGLKLRAPAMRGKAAWFAEAAREASLRVELPALAKATEWTIALWEILEVKEWLTAPDENLLTLLDAAGKPIIKLSKSGGVFVYENEREVYLDCFDALYWVQGSREHLALTWEAGGNGVPSPGGILRAYWKARPYAALALDLKRRPVALEIGQPMAGLAVDDLFVFDTALSLRSVWELMRFEDGDVAALEKRLGEREVIEANRPTAKRRAAWAALAKRGQLIEAEAGGGAVVRAPAEKPDKNGRFSARENNAATASGRAAVATGKEPLRFQWAVAKPGEYALALRYVLDRRMHPLWPQDSKAKTPWTENFAEVEVRLDGKLLGTEKLFPTGTTHGHRGDVEPWAWHSLGGGKLRLGAGRHTLSMTFKGGLAKPVYDALLVSGEAGPRLAHPRWADQYRIPPAWWVKKNMPVPAGGGVGHVYTVTLRNRCNEPCSYEIIVDNERCKFQKVGASVKRIALKPFEEKEFEITFSPDPRLFEFPSGWANIYLWNEDVALRQKYRLWNLVWKKKVKHPVLAPAPDAKLRVAFREWLKGRDPKALTPQLREWTRGRNVALSDGSQPVRGFPRALDGERLAALDAWMGMSAAEIEQYLPDGPAEHNGYGTGWERIGLEYSGLWHKQPKVKTLAPAGDIDLVTSLTVEAPPQKGKTKIYRKTYVAGKDNDLIGSVRDTRWKSMMGHGISGAAPYGDTPLGRTSHSGITLLAEAYYLTGDKKYAKKAFQMAHIFARKYTGLTKHFNYTLNREDRDWWGGRIGGRYLMKFGPRYYHAMGIYVLDLLWDGLAPAERIILEHNIVRWGMYEGMSGPLFEEPAYFAAVNKEDMPYLPMGRVLGDPAPVRGLQFFYDIYKGIVLDDGIHKCSIGSYGGVSGYISFMQKLHGHGLDVSGNTALRNAFLAHPSFIFAGGGFPNIDDGGGVNLNGLGAGFGCPSPQQYAWAKTIFKDPRHDQWPALIAATERVNNSPQKDKAARMRVEYAAGKLPLEKLWPNLYVAPIKGLAILRNRTAAEPIDWAEVIFDYGLFGGRSHGHPAKLATIPSFNGQIVSMEYGYGKLGELMSLYTSSYAHNVVVADGRGQFATGGAVPVGSLRGTFSDAAVQWADAESTRIYNGIEMRRTVFTTDFGIVDLHLCRSKMPHQYDWMFHSFGEAKPEGITLKPVKQLAATGPLRFARSPRSAASSSAVVIRWDNAPRTKPPKKQSTAILHENAHVRVWALPVKNTTVTLFAIPMNENVGSEIDYLMLRRRAKSTVFATVQEPWRESTAPKVSEISRMPVRAKGKQIPAHEATALHVKLIDGTRRVFFVNYSPGEKTIGKVTTNADVATWEIVKNDAIQNAKHSKGASFKTR